MNGDVRFRDITFGGISGEYQINDLWTWQFGISLEATRVVGVLVAAARTVHSSSSKHSTPRQMGVLEGSVRNGVRTGHNWRKQDETRGTVSPWFS